MNKRVTFNTPGDAHELTFSTSRRLPLLELEPIKQIFLCALAESRSKFDFQVWAYVLMPDHVHLLLYPTQEAYDTDRIRQDIKKVSAFRAVSWLREHDQQCARGLAMTEGSRTRTRFWQDGKGYDRNLTSPEAIQKSIEYIHSNPVKKGLCSHAKDWRWSSARQYEIGEPGDFPVDIWAP